MKTWRERIAEARQSRIRLPNWLGSITLRGQHFTADDVWEANHWYACAVGEHREAVPLRVTLHDGEPVPLDHDLRRMGLEFGVRVGRHDIDGAERLLEQIENRALQLKREQAG